MADESMVRNLAAQADAIWPQELPLVRRYHPVDILDVGCGTGEITLRLGTEFPAARITGVDIVESHLELARRRNSHGDRVRFQTADAFELPFADASFDLVVCRHVLQAIPTPERILAEMVRVARPGGVLHVLAEDYDMIFAGSPRIDVSELWHGGPRAYGKATGVDLHIGRNIYRHLTALPLDDIEVHYAHVDTQRVPRETFATIYTAWRDGYVESIAKHWGRSEAEVRDYFDATIEAIRTGYALWLVPIWTSRRR